MYVEEAVDLAASPVEFWLWAGRDDGADLRLLGTRMGQSGPLRHLLRFAHPYEDRGHRIGFDIEMRPHAGQGGAIFLRWDAHFARLEGELEVVAGGPQASRLRLSASYEPAWAAAVADRPTLQHLARDAVRAFLGEVAAAAAPEPTRQVPEPAATAPKHRVLIEDEDPAWYHFMVQMADADEYEFASCRGPFLTDGGCPILRGERCLKVEWADTVLHSLDRRQPANGAVLEAVQRRYPDFAPTLLDGEPVTFCLTRRKTSRAVACDLASAG